jgi:phage tail sheath protein FI
VFSAYDLISDAETENVDYILCGPSMSTVNDSIAKAQKVIDIAANRKDCIAFVSPQRSDVVGVATTAQIVDRTITFFNQLTSTSYAVFDNNYKYVYDKYNDKYRYIPCNADVAGLTLSTTLNQEPWYSPAGFNRGNLKNAIKLAYSPLKDQRDQLYNARVNPIVSFPGQGIILFGDKTALAYQSAFDRINIRRLFLVIEEAISGSARSQLFELNDEFTRSSFKNLVEPYLRSVQARRGIVDFLVVCDASNNPPEAIDRGEFYAEIFVKPTKSVNYITLTFTATRTGASFAEVTS